MKLIRLDFSTKELGLGIMKNILMIKILQATEWNAGENCSCHHGSPLLIGLINISQEWQRWNWPWQRQGARLDFLRYFTDLLFHDSIPVAVYMSWVVSQLSMGQLRNAKPWWKTLHGQNIYICSLQQSKRWKSIHFCSTLFSAFWVVYHLFSSISCSTYIL